MAKQLTTQNATITTAAVELKTLTVSGKQVTLAVFRQLREEPLIADDGTLNGVPWGTVNYHPDKCGDEASHWHVVWQRGSELRRSHVDKTAPFDPDDFRRMTPSAARSEAADRLLTARVREWAAGRIDQAPLPKRTQFPVTYGAQRQLDTAHGFPFWVVASAAAVDAADKKQAAENWLTRLTEARKDMAKPLTQYTKTEWRQDALDRARRAVDEANSEQAAAIAVLDAEIATWGMSYQELTNAYAAAVKAEADRRRRHRDTRGALAELPQLFIAV